MENVEHHLIHAQLCSCVSLLLFHTYKGVSGAGGVSKLRSAFVGPAVIDRELQPSLLSDDNLAFGKGSALLFSSPVHAFIHHLQPGDQKQRPHHLLFSLA